MSEDQGVVNAHVDDQGDDRYVKGYIHGPHTAQGGHEYVCNDKQCEGPLDQDKVALALGNDLRRTCEKFQQGAGKKGADRHDDDTAQDAQLQGNAGQCPDGLDALLAPILGRQDDQGIADGQGHLLDHEEDLVDGGCPGEGILAVAAKHDVVGHVDAVGHEILQRHNDKHFK